MGPTKRLGAFFAALSVVLLIGSAAVAAPGDAGRSPTDARSVAEYWTAERMAQAIPRDLVLDERGLAYLRMPDGTLEPHGHSQPGNSGSQLRAAPSPRVKPENPGGGGGGGGGSTDTAGPAVTILDPVGGDTISSSHTFAADVTDESGVKSVTFEVVYPGGQQTQSFSASSSGGTTWSLTIQGFTDGDWSWYVVAKDNAKKGGNTTTTDPVAFVVDTGSSGGGGGGGSDVVTNAEWSFGGAVQTAVGRLYFEMPDRGPFWAGYVCSGTVVDDGTGGRSVILTAAHCVYDDVNKVFARNVLFIPNQASTTGSGTDRNCDNDPLGCWAPSYGVVDDDWTTRTFPDNIPWDYAYYVVPDSGAHSGTSVGTDVLDAATATLGISFDAPTIGAAGDRTHALGYSYSDDPNLMYCAEGLGTENSYEDLWLSQCDLSGGSSGGPWSQPMDTGTGSGPIISVNSWGYTNQPGMAGPRFHGTSASCVFGAATTSTTTTELRGVVAGCP